MSMSKNSKKRLSNIWFLFMIFICGAVSVYDNVLNVITMDSLADVEQNPIAKYIIKAYGVPIFVQLKAIMTLIVLILMIKCVYTKFRIAILGVCLYQVGLFLFLTFHTKEFHSFFIIDDMFVSVKMVIDFYFNEGKL